LNEEVGYWGRKSGTDGGNVKREREIERGSKDKRQKAAKASVRKREMVLLITIMDLFMVLVNLTELGASFFNFSHLKRADLVLSLSCLL
jgi:hypothetical protein